MHTDAGTTIDLAALRRRLAQAADQPDADVEELLTAGYAHVLDLEAEQLASERRLDDLIATGDEREALEAARSHRALRATIKALKDELDALAATRRLRRSAAPPPPGP